MRSWPALACCVLVLPSLVGCSSATEEDGYAALEADLKGTRHVARPSDEPSERRAEARPLAGAGPHTATLKAHFGLATADGARSVRVNRVVERDVAGRFHIQGSRYWADPHVAPEGELDGRESIFDGERLAVRRAWGPWMLRDTVGGQEERLLREAYDVADALLGSFRPYLSLIADGRDTIAGLDATWFRVELDSQVAPRPLDAESLASLRAHATRWPAWIAATHQPYSAQGRIALRGRDDDRGEMVAGRFEITGGARWGAIDANFGGSVDIAIAPLPPKPGFTIPADALPPTRDRPWRMIQDVMGDQLAAPWAP